MRFESPEWVFGEDVRVRVSVVIDGVVHDVWTTGVLKVPSDGELLEKARYGTPWPVEHRVQLLAEIDGVDALWEQERE